MDDYIISDDSGYTKSDVMDYTTSELSNYYTYYFFEEFMYNKLENENEIYKISVEDLYNNFKNFIKVSNLKKLKYISMIDFRNDCERYIGELCNESNFLSRSGLVYYIDVKKMKAYFKFKIDTEDETTNNQDVNYIMPGDEVNS